MQELKINNDAEDNYILEMLNINKNFIGVKALEDVSFRLKKGEVHAIVGENGAGKSTLMKILMGVYIKDSGDIIIDGKKVEFKSAIDAYNMGISMIFQELSLIPQLTVSQNIFLRIEPRSKLPFFVNENSITKKSLELMKNYKININPDIKVENLNRGTSQIVEILKVLAQKSKIIIMDEPTASLTREEELILYNIIKMLKTKGMSIIFISHRLKEIFEICDYVTVLRDGKNVTSKNIAEINEKNLIELMTGKKIECLHHKAVTTLDSKDEKYVLEVNKLSFKSRLMGVSFKVKKGEILAVTGLMGSGKTEIATILFGLNKPDTGDIFVNGRKVDFKNPFDAIKEGLFLIPEDRKNEGLFLSHSIEHNLILPIIKKISRGSFVSDIKSKNKAQEQVKNMSIKTPSIKQEVRYLSGGNQQKVVIGKWLMERPTILILDEPTVGLDVKSKSEVRKIICDLAKSDCSVIVFSSDLDEIIEIADRIIVLYKGTVFKEFINFPAVKEEILHSAIQGI
ncbi:MAG: sugar ABC transporter ATP-binding protein [Actinobacteria bacterium]|nr:sugar ABC transporter ATP-binding protein [Cyanobacteriota bacterium]MCL5771927.1 sugar ABC transporter ATP-binding protein [Actinomycetota bacterium]